MELITIVLSGGPVDGQLITVDMDKVESPEVIQWWVDAPSDPVEWEDRLPDGATVARYLRPASDAEIAEAQRCYLDGEPIKYRWADTGTYRHREGGDQ